jgi:hypothetical protein
VIGAAERRAASAQRSAALSAAATAIARAVPDLRGLLLQLEFAGGHARLIRAIEAELAERRRHPIDIGARR